MWVLLVLGFFFFLLFFSLLREMDEIEQRTFSGTKANSEPKQIPAWSGWCAHGEEPAIVVCVPFPPRSQGEE